MNTIDNPNDLYFDQLRDLYNAESQILLALPELIENAALPDLRDLLVLIERQTARQKKRLRTIFQRHDTPPDGDLCQAIRGLIAGGRTHLFRTTDRQVADLLLIAHTRRIKHYEIAGYSFAAALARQLDLASDAAVLDEILAEEERAAARLAEIAGRLFKASTAPLETSIAR